MGHPLTVAIETNNALSARTKALYLESVARFLRFALPRAGGDPDGYTCGLVEDWFVELAREGLQPQTIGIHRKAIRLASRRHAQRTGRQAADFAAAATCAKGRRQPPREPLSYEEADKLIETCAGGTPQNDRDRALLVLALRTGLRRGGLVALDLAGLRPPKITTIDKGGEAITLTADPEVFVVLEPWLHRLKAAGIRSGAVFRRVTSKGTIGERVSAFQLWHVFRTRAEAAGIRHVFPHLARHSTVTWLREAGRTAAEVSKLTGQSERTIENIYTHVRVDGAVGAVLPSFLGKKP